VRDDARSNGLVGDARRAHPAPLLLASTCGDAPQSRMLTLLTPTERSAMLSTNSSLGLRHLSGSASASSCMATADPGPEVRGSPPVWYLAWPIAFGRAASARA
jgi:hypothetical protein